MQLHFLYCGVFAQVKKDTKTNVMAVRFRYGGDYFIILALPDPNTLYCNENAVFH